MARIRTIKPQFFLNDDIAALHPLDRLLFIGLWTLADRAGRLEDRPTRIKVQILPYDKHEVEPALDRLVIAGFISRYSSSENKYIEINSFTKHQCCNVKEPESTIPAPCENDTSTISALQEGKGREGKGTGREQEGKGMDILSGDNPDHVDSEKIKAIIDDLNQKAGTSYKPTTRDTKDRIRARWNDGFRVPDFLKVHTTMCSKWLTDPKMRQYLRPQTLYGPKFESYLNAVVTLSEKGVMSEKTERGMSALEQFVKKGKDINAHS